MAEKLSSIALDRIGVCIACNVSATHQWLDRDHMFPWFMLTGVPLLDPRQHPFRAAVSPKRFNVFRMCRDHHIEQDEAKAHAFWGSGSPDPERLVDYLRCYYPLTSNPRLFIHQVRAMRQSFTRFANISSQLNGELPIDLKEGYVAAGRKALEAVKYFEIYEMCGPLILLG